MKNFLVILFCFALMCITGACEKVDNGNTDDLPTSTPLPPMADPNDVCTSMDDLAFMEYCYKRFDVNEDGKVSQSEAAAVTKISNLPEEVRSLKGIGYFPNLEELNIWLPYGTEISELDLSNNKALKKIDCSESKLISIDLRLNQKLEELNFKDCKHLSSVLLPKTLRTISNYAFSECEALTKIVIPNTVTIIRSNAFDGCVNLSEVVLHDNITAIGDGAFQDTAIKCFTLPKSVNVVPDKLLSGCTNLRELQLHDNVTEIGEYAFSRTGINEFIFPQQVNIVEDGVFSYSHLMSVVLHEGVEKIGCNAFENTPLSEIKLPETIISIGAQAFAWCHSLQDINLPTRLETIGEEAFFWCDSLKEIKISPLVKTIERRTFMYCKSLEKVVLPDGLESIGDRMIGTGAFAYCEKLRQIQLPESLGIIGGYSFTCSGLESIEIPEGIYEINEGTFYNCKSLRKVVLPNTVYKINCENYSSDDQYGAFEGCGLLDINFPENLSEISRRSFWDTRIEHVILSSNIKIIESMTFSDVGIFELTMSGLYSGSDNDNPVSHMDKAIVRDTEFPSEYKIEAIFGELSQKPILYVYSDLVNEWKEKAGEYFSEILPIETMSEWSRM